MSKENPSPALPSLTPRLIVERFHEALAFYEEVFGAKKLEHFFDEAIGKTVHAALSFGGTVVSFADEDVDSHNLSASRLGGSPVLLQIEVEDPDATGARAVARGARIVFPIADQFYGRREGRVVDPFGHVWIVGKEIEKLSDQEVQARVDRFHDRDASEDKV